MSSKRKSKEQVNHRVFKKLAYKNVKKSAKDYLIYFFTITFGVCLFYSFNSISAQFEMLQVNDRLNYLTFTSGMMAAISVVVCIIIGFLIVYANRFLLQRRKKEIGIYITLGMEQSDIAALLRRETVIVGIFSLAAGIVAGVFASQGLAMITARIIGASLASFRPVLSPLAAVECVIFFSIMFYVVHLFNVKEIKKLKLIDLLNGERKNEKVKGGMVRDTLVFIISIAFIAAGYGWTFFHMEETIKVALAGGILFITAGTFLFFSSAVNAVLGILEKNKRFYYKGLNMFVVKQLASKVKSNSVSISVITLLLFLSIVSSAFGLSGGESIAVKEAAPYDATLKAYQNSEYMDANASIQDVLDKMEISDFAKESQTFTVYYSDGVNVKDFLLPGAPVTEKVKESIDSGDNMNVIGIDDYNKALELQGKEPIRLGADQFAVNYNVNYVGDVYQDYLKHHKAGIEVAGRQLTIAPNGVLSNSYANEDLAADMGTIIVAQELTHGLKPNLEFLNMTFKNDRQDTYNQYLKAVDNLPDNVKECNRKDLIVQIASDKMTISYLGIYLGIGFLITAGAVLALQQLSQWVDNEKRYRLLDKLGTKRRDMKKSVSSQLLTYFGLPLILGALHASVVLMAIFSSTAEMTNAIILESVTFAGGIVLIVYGIYFMTTYFESKRITGLLN